MSVSWGRRTVLWMMDHALVVAGAALLVAGLAGPPWLTPAGWGALGLALFAGMAESEGYAIPRPGRSPIISVGCWDVPIAFGVSRGGRHLLFTRGTASTDESWSEEYAVYELPSLGEGQIRTALAEPKAGAQALEVRVPMTVLHFEHHGQSYVYSASLGCALQRVRPPAA